MKVAVGRKLRKILHVLTLHRVYNLLYINYIIIVTENRPAVELSVQFDSYEEVGDV